MKQDIPKKECWIIDHVQTGAVIRQARVECGITLKAVADAMGISSPFLSDLERGRRNWTEEHFRNALNYIVDTKKGTNQ